MPDSVERKEIAREYLPTGGSDLKDGEGAFVSVDLVHGRIRAYASVEYASVAPVLVGSGWHMRWSIPLVGNDKANRLIDDIADSAASLFLAVSIREEPDPHGVTLYAGAGTCIDEIQRRCAEEWRAFYEDPR
ncbi:hypothetical protein [Streptomyces levis]|uniref:hypothetical protein n=1 Tax=Streptomyces levis TaxID=285566 RepID=UPI003C7AB9F8